jgi:hypothetical protein
MKKKLLWQGRVNKGKKSRRFYTSMTETKNTGVDWQKIKRNTGLGR